MSPITQLPSEPNGTAKETSWFRQLLRCVRERTVRVGQGLRVSYKANETLIELAAAPRTLESEGQTGGSVRFQIVSVEGDYVTARRQTEEGAVDPNEAVTYIAKPHFLRVSVLNTLSLDNWRIAISSPGNTRTLTSEAGSGVTVGRIVRQHMNYPYGVGNVIYADKPEGKTSIEHPAQPGQKIEWLDQNRDARNFHQTRIELNACVLVNGVPTTKVIVFEAGPVP